MEIPESASRGYTMIPKGMLSDMRDSTVAIGVYALVGRLWRISHMPVPLSAKDICRFDPSCSYGAARRALTALTNRGWLEAHHTEPKYRYTPTWGRGRRGEEAKPWNPKIKALGCPRTMLCVRLDDALLDVYIGRLEPHEFHTAEVERYWTEPYINLRDVSTYIMGLRGTATSDPPLERLGLLENGHSLPLPERTADLLAVLSQRALWTENAPTPSAAGLLRFGLTTERRAAPAAADTGQPLFFVANGIAGVIGPRTGGTVGYAPALTDSDERPITAPERGKPADHSMAQSAPGSIRENRDSHGSTHHPPIGGGGGRPFHSAAQGRERRSGAARQADPERRTRSIKQASSNKETRPANQAESPAPTPDTESTRLLQALHVSPRVVARFADLDPAQVRAAIADAESREEVRDRAAWAVSLLKQHQSTGWNLVAAQEARETTRSGPWTAADVQRWSDSAPATLHAEPAPTRMADPPHPHVVSGRAIVASATPTRMVDTPRPTPILRPAASRPETPIRNADPPLVRPAPVVFVPKPVVINPPSNDDIATGIRCALRAALPRDTWPVVDALAITCEQDTWTLCFARTAERLRYGAQMLAIARAELAESHLPDSVRVADRPVAPPPPVVESDAGDEGRPDWIDSSQWRGFSPMVRAALRGATLEGGVMVARNAAAQRVLERFGPGLSGGAPC